MAAILFLLISILLPGLPHPDQPENPDGPLIIIKRSGGFSGGNDQVSVFSDGRVLDEAGKVRHLPAAAVTRFVQLVEKVAAQMPDQPTVAQMYCTDCFTYVIKISRDEAVKTFLLKEPLHLSSENESEDTRSVRDFLSLVFSQPAPQ